jgi:hypothetical protein
MTRCRRSHCAPRNTVSGAAQRLAVHVHGYSEVQLGPIASEAPAGFTADLDGRLRARARPQRCFGCFGELPLSSKSVFLSALPAFSNARVAASESHDIGAYGRRRVERRWARDHEGGILETSLPQDTCCCKIRPPRPPSNHPTPSLSGFHVRTQQDPAGAASMQHFDGQTFRTRDERGSFH